tara:strand:+ start:980 stop:1945 length:966 start_codon:yes stop_codon:yes gene_type:complete
MSYNGSGTFVINSTGQPVVTGTVISSSTFNSLTADLGTGLSTAITKDGQTTTTAKIPFAQGLSAAVASNFAAGTVGAPSIYLSTDTTTGLYRIGANNDGFAISGVKLLDLGSALVGVTGALTVSTTLNVTGVATLGNGAILGTPASGTVTNLTGTASININGTVGATTPTTGAFTSGTFSTTLGVTGLLSVGAGGINLTSATGTSYVVSSFTATLTGCTTSPTATFYYTIIGDTVTVEMTSNLVGESNTTACTVTGFPAAICPTNSAQVVLTVRNNAVAAISNGYVTSSGVLILQRDPQGTAFTTSGSKGAFAFCFTYKII